MSYSFANDPNSPARPLRLRDQPERTWLTCIEKRNGGQCGLMVCEHRTPKNHAPPWLPDQRYFRFDPDDPGRFSIDYTSMLADRKRAHDDYHARAVEEATAREWQVPEKPGYGEPYKYEFKLTQIVGRPPKPLEPIVAAMQGNSWILGLSDTVDPRLLPLVRKPSREEQLLAGLPDLSDASLESSADDDDEPVVLPMTYNEFVAEQRKQGRSMKDAAALWRQRKAQLATVGG